MGREIKSGNVVREQVVLFTRYPDPGRAKTRLIPHLGEQGAADLQRRMTEHTLAQVEKLRQKRGIDLEIRYEGCDASLIARWLDMEDVCCRPQGPGNLGERMRRAILDAFDAGTERVIVVGCDCPALSPPIIEQALDSLQQYDLVVGPAVDGGYYLIGLRAPSRMHNGNDRFSLVFDDIPWGTDSVLDRTLSNAREGGLSLALLESLADVDRPEDLCHFHNYSDS